MPMTNTQRGWGMVGVAFLVVNCGTVTATAIAGAVLPTLERDLDVNRATASTAISAMMLSYGLASPFVGSLLQRISIRTSMTIGAILNIIGYALITVATQFWEVLLSYLLVVGPGVALLTAVPASTLVSRWFSRNRGKALGMANMPLFFLIAPPTAALLIAHGGRQLLFGVMAVLFVALLPIIRCVIDNPPSANSATNQSEATPPATWTNVALLKDARFWILSASMGVMSGVGTVLVTHIMPIGIGKGLTLTTASILLSGIGAASIGGAIVFGWLIDRLGALRALLINLAVQAVFWLVLIKAAGFFDHLLIAAVLGVCAGATVALHGAAANELFGTPSVGRVLGMGYVIKLPFWFTAAPIVGYLFDRAGDYHIALLTLSAVCAVTVAALTTIAFRGQR